MVRINWCLTPIYLIRYLGPPIARAALRLARPGSGSVTRSWLSASRLCRFSRLFRLASRVVRSRRFVVLFTLPCRADDAAGDLVLADDAAGVRRVTGLVSITFGFTSILSASGDGLSLNSMIPSSFTRLYISLAAAVRLQASMSIKVKISFCIVMTTQPGWVSDNSIPAAGIPHQLSGRSSQTVGLKGFGNIAIARKSYLIQQMITYRLG